MALEIVGSNPITHPIFLKFAIRRCSPITFASAFRLWRLKNLHLTGFTCPPMSLASAFW